ncbi:Dynamin central region-containing protein 1 [Elsinoe fawcettii]|nr:Dynamin central region-containing protein 1 [Elsinoe fawcettii]
MVVRQDLSRVISDLDSNERQRVLGVVDDLRQLGVNEDIPLPQLVVVGDQSSGKSSLLEGLTGLSFPIASELCTRFATQIVLRRAVSQESAAKISILPGNEASLDESRTKALLSFRREIRASELTGQTFAAILDEAAIQMGLPTILNPNTEELSRRFSNDILRIELSGPEQQHLSVVDVPGLFHSKLVSTWPGDLIIDFDSSDPTKFQTEEDVGVIRELLKSYMSDRRTIILAVMDARNNLANQEVFSMARDADPHGRRTLGIITKCDAVQSGDEDMVLRIAKNEIERLHHGWFVVRNRSTEEINDGVTLAERHSRERQFFRTRPWNGLSEDRKGIDSLKRHLGKLLYDHIKNEFPDMVNDIRHHVKETQSQLDALGPARESSVQQRQFLSRIARELQDLTQDALQGNYSSDWSAGDARKLRMLMHVENDSFADKMARTGHTRPFQTTKNKVDKEYNRKTIGDESIYDWIRHRYRESRGAELPGCVNPNVLQYLFRQQAEGWRALSEKYLSNTHDLMYSFIDSAIDDIVADTDVRERLKARHILALRKAKESAQTRLRTILNDELGGILQTVNHYFADNLTACRQERVIHRLHLLGLHDGQNHHIDFNAITKAAHLSNEEQAVYDIHDTLKAYYRVAIKRFIDTVIIQVSERTYVSEAGPLRSFTPESVLDWEEDELSSTVGETFAMTNARTDVLQRLQRLESALRLAEATRI